MKYKASKVNFIVENVLSEAAGGVIARSPATRGNVGRPEPDVTFVPGYNTSTPEMYDTVTDTVRDIQVPKYLRRSGAVYSTDMPDEIRTLTDPYTKNDELLKQLRDAHPELKFPLKPVEPETRFIKPYAPGMFKQEPVSEPTKETEFRVVPETKPTPAVDPASKESPKYGDTPPAVSRPTNVEPFFDVKELKRQFTTFPTISKPIESAKKGAEAVKTGAKFAVQHPIKTAGAIGVMAAPFAVGYGVEQLVDVAADAAGMPEREYDMTKPAFENELPYSREYLKSMAGWAAMEGTGKAIANVAAQRALSAGIGTAVAGGALAGALVPAVAYTGFETGRKIGELTGLHDYQDTAKAAELMQSIEKTKGKLPDEYPSLEKVQRLAELDRMLADTSEGENVPAGAKEVVERSKQKLMAERDRLRKEVLEIPAAKTEQEQLERENVRKTKEMKRAEKAKEARAGTKLDVSEMTPEELKQELKRLTEQ